MYFPAFSLGSPELWNNMGLLILAVVAIVGLCVVAYQALKVTTPFARAMVAVAVVMTVFTATPNPYKFLTLLLFVLIYLIWAWWQAKSSQSTAEPTSQPQTSAAAKPSRTMEIADAIQAARGGAERE